MKLNSARGRNFSLRKGNFLPRKEVRKKATSSKSSSSNLSPRKIKGVSSVDKARFVLSSLEVSGLRSLRSGALKQIQINSPGRAFLKKNPGLMRFFLKSIPEIKIRGGVKKGAVEISAFNPRDSSSFHSFMYLLRVKRKKFIVKELSNPVFPVDAHTQFVLHKKLASINPHLRRWNSEVLEYSFAFQNKRVSYLVGEFVGGITLEKWLRQDKRNENSAVFQRFLKAEKVLKKKLGIKDVTTRNVIYSPKTDKLVFIDLMQ